MHPPRRRQGMVLGGASRPVMLGLATLSIAVGEDRQMTIRVIGACVLFCLMLIPAAALAQDAMARVVNLSLAYPRGERCVVRLAVTGANEVAFDVSGLLPQTVKVAEGEARYEIDTTLLRSADYEVRARLLRDGSQVGEAMMPLTVGPPRDTERMPVWKWGHIGYEPEELRYWNTMGFTGGTIGQAKEPAPRLAKRGTQAKMLDEGVKLDMELGYFLFPLYYDTPAFSLNIAGNEALRGTFSTGVQPDTVQPLAPKVIEYSRNVADTWTKELAEFRGLRFLFLNTEFETSMAPHPESIRMAKEEIGIDISTLPIEEGSRKRGRLAVNPAEFTDGIIDDEHPHYKFLRWWWERGHGTVVVNAAMHDAAKQHRPDLITYHDPYRLAPVRHSHKGLDMISTWTYGTPDIKRLSYATYMQAAARPDNLLVNQTITMLLYGFMVKPLTDSTADFAFDFGGSDPFFQVGPDYTRQAGWMVVSQRPDVLGYYIASNQDLYNPRLDPNVNSPPTAGAIAEVTQRLVQPYGATILDTERLHPRVAVLASATGAWFHVGTHNSGYPAEQTLPYASLLWMNHVPFDVLLDDDLIEGAASQYDALVLPFSATVTAKMAERLREFRKAGGKVIVNEPFRMNLPGALRTKYDFSMEYNVRGTAQEIMSAEAHRQRLEEYAADLAKRLGAGALHGPVRPSSMRVLTNSLEGGDVRYHFLINDDKTYGPRFGHYKIWFDLGVPQTVQVTIEDEQRPVLYDAIRRKRIERAIGEKKFEIGLAAADGKLIAALPEPINEVRIEAPQQAKAGEAVTLRLTVLGESGNTIRGSLPLRVDIDDAYSRRTEWSRFTTTRRGNDGVCEFTFVPAINDALGNWTIRVTDLIGDKTARATIKVTR